VRVAVITDVHGNAALDAVLAEVECTGVGAVVVAGDVVPGPQPAEVLERLAALERARFVRGNGDREVVEAFDARRRLDPAEQDPVRRAAAWTAERIGAAERDVLAAFEDRVQVGVDGLGEVLVCHATPRSDEEIVTSRTPDAVVAQRLAGVRADVVVCGHTHAQYDRVVDGVRLVNAGSVGMGYEGRCGAFWVLLGPGGEHRRTDYDVEAAAARIAASGFPDAEDFASAYLLSPPTAREAEEHFERVAAQRGER
jgi:putative phosphoesterase